MTGVEVVGVEHDDKGFHIRYVIGGTEQAIHATHLLIATGRKANRYVLANLWRQGDCKSCDN